MNATEFGASTENYAAATNYAQTLQAAIISPTQETTAQHISLVSCETDSQKLSDLNKITTATLDTPERRVAYAAAFAGAVLSSEGCAQNLLAPSRSAALAQSINVVYINGIQNTLEDAGKTQTKIYDTLQSSINHTGGAKKSFIVTGVWNPVGWYGTKDDGDLSQDKKELFLLKTAEEKFASDFKEIMLPFNASTTITIDQVAATRVSAYLEDMTPGDNSLETDNKITASDMQATKKAVISLVNRIKARGSAIVVAHSQGNLLANLAWANLASDTGNDVSKMVRVINVANTSEFSVNNLNFTHAEDGALFSRSIGLVTLPSQGFNWTRTTPLYCLDDSACDFTIAAATFGKSTEDPELGPLNHGMVTQYMSDAHVPVAVDQGVRFTPNADKFVDRFEDFVYAAAESLSMATSGTAPSAPTGVTASGGDGQVTISWNAVLGATSYNLYWSTSSGVTKTSGTKILNVTSPYTHTGRTNGTTYYYVVTAVNSYGESAESTQMSASPSSGAVLDTTSPATLTGLAATTASTTQINLAWTASPENDVAGYKVYKNGTYLKSVTSTTTSDSGLSASTQYCYTVSAYDSSNNESPQSSSACATTNGTGGVSYTW